MVWLKRKITLSNESQRQFVKPADIPAYTRHIGIGLIVIGAGVCITGVLNMFWSPFWWIPLLIGIVAGLVIIFKAQKKYNNGALI